MSLFKFDEISFNSKKIYFCSRDENYENQKFKEKINAYEKRKEANAEVNKTLFGAFSAALLGSFLFPLAPLVSTISVVAMPIIFFLGAFLGVVSGAQNLIEKKEILEMKESLIKESEKNSAVVIEVDGLKQKKSWFQQLIN